jgi:hypothetical protein
MPILSFLFFSSVFLFASVPFFINGCVASSGTDSAPLYFAGFCTATFLAITAMGGVFSVLPPYEAELYGPKYLGAIHARFLPFSTLRGIAGPWLILGLRSREEAAAARQLLERADPEAFRCIFFMLLNTASTMFFLYRYRYLSRSSLARYRYRYE